VSVSEERVERTETGVASHAFRFTLHARLQPPYFGAELSWYGMASG
jgi:hypothetical protein